MVTFEFVLAVSRHYVLVEIISRAEAQIAVTTLDNFISVNALYVLVKLTNRPEALVIAIIIEFLFTVNALYVLGKLISRLEAPATEVASAFILNVNIFHMLSTLTSRLEDFATEIAFEHAHKVDFPLTLFGVVSCVDRYCKFDRSIDQELGNVIRTDSATSRLTRCILLLGHRSAFLVVRNLVIQVYDHFPWVYVLLERFVHIRAFVTHVRSYTKCVCHLCVRNCCIRES